jgi:zinc protease
MRILLLLIGLIVFGNRCLAVDVKELTTPSGINLWMVEDRSVPLVSVRATFAHGEVDDPKGFKGAAMLLSGLVDEGAGPYDGAQFRARMEDLGLRLFIDPEMEDFDFGFSVPSFNLKDGAELMRTALVDNKFPDEAMERMRQQFVTHEESALRSADAIAARAFTQLALPGHPYGRLSEDVLKGLESLTRENLLEQRKRIFSREGLRLVVVGDISPDGARDLVERVFGGLPQGPGETKLPQVKLADGPRLKIVPFNSPQTLLMFGTQGIPESDPDFLAARVAASIIHATLVDIVRQQRGLSYDVTYDIYQRDATSIALGKLKTSNATAKQSVEAIKLALDLALNNIGDENVALTVRYLKGQSALGFETNSELAGVLQLQQIQGYASNYISLQNELLDRVTGDDVRRAVKRFLDPEKLLVVAVGQPEGLAEQ